MSTGSTSSGHRVAVLCRWRGRRAPCADRACAVPISSLASTALCRGRSATRIPGGPQQVLHVAVIEVPCFVEARFDDSVPRRPGSSLSRPWPAESITDTSGGADHGSAESSSAERSFSLGLDAHCLEVGRHAVCLMVMAILILSTALSRVVHFGIVPRRGLVNCRLMTPSGRGGGGAEMNIHWRWAAWLCRRRRAVLVIGPARGCRGVDRALPRSRDSPCTCSSSPGWRRASGSARCS